MVAFKVWITGYFPRQREPPTPDRTRTVARTRRPKEHTRARLLVRLLSVSSSAAAALPEKPAQRFLPQKFRGPDPARRHP
jgi:hypothetical protein